jgi:putative ABC transport system ATP-binding protein
MIIIQNMSKTYNQNKENELKVLKNISFQIERGEMVAIMGVSGAGKSTLLHILGCIDNFGTGTYTFDGVEIKSLKDKELSKMRNRNIGFVLQDFALIEEETVLENVMIPLYFDKTPYVKMKSKALDALKKVGIGELSKKRVSKLSGGQKQRVAIARAIVIEPSLILADEPTGSLDSVTSAEIIKLFKEICDNDRSIIIVTHDAQIAAQCQRIIEIKDGAIFEK